MDALFGNGPLVISKTDGRIAVAGTYSPDRAIQTAAKSLGLLGEQLAGTPAASPSESR